MRRVWSSSVICALGYLGLSIGWAMGEVNPKKDMEALTYKDGDFELPYRSTFRRRCGGSCRWSSFCTERASGERTTRRS